MKGMAPSQKPGQEDWLPGKGLSVIRHFVEPFHAKYAEPHLLQPVLKPRKAKCAQGINPAHICRRERTDAKIPGPAGRPGLGRARAIYLKRWKIYLPRTLIVCAPAQNGLQFSEKLLCFRSSVKLHNLSLFFGMAANLTARRFSSVPGNTPCTAALRQPPSPRGTPSPARRQSDPAAK